jgi:hypothetical protein
MLLPWKVHTDVPQGEIKYENLSQGRRRYMLACLHVQYISSSAPPSRGGDNIKVQNHLILVFNGSEKSTVGFIAEAALQQAE